MNRDAPTGERRQYVGPESGALYGSPDDRGFVIEAYEPSGEYSKDHTTLTLAGGQLHVEHCTGRHDGFGLDFPVDLTADQWAALTAHGARMMYAVRQREFMAERQRYIDTPPGERDTATYFDPLAARDAAADAVAGVIDVLSKTVGYVDCDP